MIPGNVKGVHGEVENQLWLLSCSVSVRVSFWVAHSLGPFAMLLTAISQVLCVEELRLPTTLQAMGKPVLRDLAIRPTWVLNQQK